ncbi:uncharacterized protein LOC106152937 [Lingula anatina]|uniref:Uncharacterized protein LOC106152937 n=1 Tax=Lingula anatina TaxID=7574 RepID=A0A1S3H830_LINAN|nr:uncharacterized protein LOC106152937 [Lingula anatina]|eukprot:XP_013382137.1 uncharacterized protein LOC106152937 [Lingula anatina]
MGGRSSVPADVPELSDQDEATVVDADVTFVTGFFDIGRGSWTRYKRDNDKYFTYAESILSLQSNFIVFVPEAIRSRVEVMRANMMDKTEIISLSKEELHCAQYLDQISTIMASDEFKKGHKLLKHPEGFCPWYNIVTNSKAPLLLKASQFGRFNTKFFYWIDFGYGAGKPGRVPPSPLWFPQKIMDSDDHRVIFILRRRSQLQRLECIQKEYKVNKDPIFAGGFFGGTRRAVEAYVDLHKNIFEELLNQNIVDDDQTTVTACYLKEPDLFRLIDGKFCDAFKLFK